jgi:hypothetical protein
VSDGAFTGMLLLMQNELDDPLADLIPRRLISMSSGSDECLDIASNWFQNCWEGHAECSENTRSPKLLPTRVIDIGLPNSNDSPVLLVSNGCFGDWVTLSYCWGSFDSVKTTTATLKEHQASLPFESLPPLFRDAILLTRRFNYRYLWIDALCILQDSEPDWRAEAANMGYIYRNSALTIAAECSSDPTESILDTSRETSYHVKLPCSRGHQINGFIFPHPMNAGEKGPWKTRAWTLQEDVLSPRVLMWTKKQLEWDCRTVSCSEEDYTGDNDFLERKGSEHFKRICLSQEHLMQRLYRNLDLDVDVSTCDPLEIWSLILVNFVSRKVTHSTDRLPSISGVAKEVARHTGQTYKAGLWEEEIYTELLWSTNGNATRLHDDIAPSWSWASLDFSSKSCNLYYQSGRGNSHNILRLARVLSIDVSYVGTDEFGQVASGRLSIWGRCMEIVHWNKSEKGFNCHLDVGRSIESLPLDALFMQIICVEEGFVEVGADRWSRKGRIRALILKPGNGIGSKRVYKRIGVADISLKKGQGWSSRTIVVL